MKTALLYIIVFFFSAVATGQDADTIKLKDFRPVSIYKIPVTNITKAKYPVVDFHSHDYPKTDADVQAWLKTMDAMNIAKTIILTYSTGATFDSLAKKYLQYNNRFEVWCGFDYTGFGQPGWEKHAVEELERCHQKGATGVGELGDKGLGESYSITARATGVHINNPAMKSLLQKCAHLHMPVSIHVAEDQWMYEKPDSTNDGLMNSAKWQVDMSKPGILTHDELINTLEQAVKENPATAFIACHLANTNSDLSVLGKLFDRYPNLYADIAARYGEFAPIPRFTKAFFEKYGDRIVYGTDMGYDADMYKVTFRILETADEHFYDLEHFNYHWPLHGLFLNEATLKKMYNGNSKKILSQYKKAKRK